MYKNLEVSYHLREEHDLAFGPGTSSAADMLSQPSEADRIFASQLPYTTRCRQGDTPLGPTGGHRSK
jgi:hypothetical protein